MSTSPSGGPKVKVSPKSVLSVPNFKAIHSIDVNKKQKWQPHNNVGGKVWGSPKPVGYIF